ncbi:hypothetical protein [Vibrio sp. 10N.239.312.D08]|uniref:hypothetical protein n=1 Tax=Vibrio sp. 10N.239.312.D08 TaxID=3229978 RepID=UPI00354B38DD
MQLPSAKKARLSAEAISKSFNFEANESRAIIAQIFNFNSWEQLIKKLQNVEDKALSNTEEHHLNEIFVHRLSDIVGIPLNRNLQELLSKMSPYRKKPSPYRFDLNFINDSSSDTLIDFAEILEQIGMAHESGNADEAMMDSLKEMVKHFGGKESDEILSLLDNTNFDQLQNMMRETHPINDELVCNAIANFLSVDFDYIEEPNSLRVAEYYDQHGEPNPLYLTSMVASPGDSDDSAYLDLVKKIENDCDMNFEKPMLINGTVTFKEIDNKTYAVVGLWNDGLEWHWIFLGSGITPWQQKQLFSASTLDNLENSLDKVPLPDELSVPIQNGHPIHLIWHCMVKPSESPIHTQDGELGIKIDNRYVISGVTGWQSFV